MFDECVFLPSAPLPLRSGPLYSILLIIHNNLSLNKSNKSKKNFENFKKRKAFRKKGGA
jgi:hypothetical protein